MTDVRLIMGMPITVRIDDPVVTLNDLEAVFDYFHTIDEQFSTYKATSEISQLNRGEISFAQISPEMREIFELAEKTKTESQGYFNITRNGYHDPSGVVKGWAIERAAALIRHMGFHYYYIDAGGDIATSPTTKNNQAWRVGIQHPLQPDDIVKTLEIRGQGVATSGNYVRGNHIYDPKTNQPLEDIVSITVIGPSILDADRFATAAYAMGRNGIFFIESLPRFEAYMIDRDGLATETSGFQAYVSA